MRAILLAAGYGTRLRPLTNTISKCLVPIQGKPLLEIWLERLAQVGIGPFLINTHYLEEQVREFIKKSPYANLVKLIYEPQLLGTAGTLIQNIDFFQGEDGLLIHADNYCLADFQSFLRAHKQRPSECLITMMTFQTDSPSSCGIIKIDCRGVVTEFYEKVKLPPGNLANGAIYVLSAEFLKIMREEMNYARDFSREVLNQLKDKIYTYQTFDFFQDIGTIAAYNRANKRTLNCL